MLFCTSAVVLVALLITASGAINIPSDPVKRNALPQQHRAETSTSTTTYTLTYPVPYTVTKTHRPVIRTSDRTVTVTSRSPVVYADPPLKSPSLSYITFTKTDKVWVTTTVIKLHKPTVRVTQVKVTRTGRRTSTPPTPSARSSTRILTSTSSTPTHSPTTSESYTPTSTTPEPTPTSSTKPYSSTTWASPSFSPSPTPSLSPSQSPSPSPSATPSPSPSIAPSPTTGIDGGNSTDTGGLAPTNTASATTAPAVACPTNRSSVTGNTTVCATDSGNGTSTTNNTRAQVPLGKNNFFATGALTNSILLSGNTTNVTAIYSNGTSYLAGSFNHSFGDAQSMSWQSTGWFTQGGCDQAIEPYLINQCFYMGLSGNATLNLEPGLAPSLARQRIEVYTPGTTNRTYHYTWKSFLNTTSTTLQFFHLFQILSRGQISGPIVTLDAVGGTATIKDFIRCPYGCGNISLSDYSQRVILNDVVVQYGWNGSIVYTASDFLTNNVLLTYNVTNGYMGDKSVSLKFGQYRSAVSNITDVSSFVGDFTSVRLA